MADLGVKAKEFAKEHELEEKVQAFKTKAGEKIAEATKGAKKGMTEDDTVGKDVNADGDGSGEDPSEAATPVSPSNRKSVRDSLGDLASKLKPGFKVAEGSIADILIKAKAMVFKNAPPEETDVEKAAEITTLATTIELETMKSDVEGLTAKMESTAKDISNKEKVQKMLIPILGQLKIAQDKFTGMVEARKKKKAEAAAKGDTTEASAEKMEVHGDDDDDTVKMPSHFAKQNLMATAESAAKRAFEKAEIVARKVATKVGILDDGTKTAATEEPKAEEAAVEEAEVTADATADDATEVVADAEVTKV